MGTRLESGRMLFLAGAIHDPRKAEVRHKTFPPHAPRLSLNCAFFRTGRRKCMEAGAELITGRKVRSKNRNQRRKSKTEEQRTWRKRILQITCDGCRAFTFS